jgi:hypothetical protein
MLTSLSKPSFISGLAGKGGCERKFKMMAKRFCIFAKPRTGRWNYLVLASVVRESKRPAYFMQGKQE